MKLRIKRIFAFIIDWNIVLLPFAFIFAFLPAVLQKHPISNPLIALLMLFTFLAPFGIFLFRDAIFKGRSPGKRVFKLYVYDQKTLNTADTTQCALKNVLLPLCFFDAVIYLVTGKTLGDRVAGTLVATKQDLEAFSQETKHPVPVTTKGKAKNGLSVLAIIVACFLALFGLTQIILNQQKDTEEYKIAYRYFTESKAFEELNVDESKIRFNKYSLNTYTSHKDNSVTQTAEIGFVVKSQTFVVVCHKENDVWLVCDECTSFK
ncbi:MAG: RDD family protein [Clostridia bacterium]|nr:RDD family protein [Clostridia bacterium]